MNRHRRDFLKMSLGASTLGWLAPIASHSLGGEDRGRTPRDGRVLVVLQLSGGNDGLNTVVPYGDDQYYRMRPTIALSADKLHRIDSHLGFHHRMPGFKRLYDRGLLSVVQGVGYPQPDGDHAVSMQYWQTGQPHDSACQTGWLGRVADRLDQHHQSDVPAVFVGSIRQPLTLNAQTTVVPSLRSLPQWALATDSPDVTPDGAKDYRQKLVALAGPTRTGNDNPLLAVVQRGTLAACARSEMVEQILRDRATRTSSDYPASSIAQSLRTVAQLIRADAGIHVYCTELGGDGFGGFDNHANQLGNHCALLHQLSDAVAAFIDDLVRDNLAEQVLLMTYSEFGRTAAENGRRGTDHGSAAPLFLAGGGLRGGLIGSHPGFAELENGGAKFHTDFRRVYATVLDRWLGLDSHFVLPEKFEPLDLFQI